MIQFYDSIISLDWSVGEGKENSVAGARTGADPAYSWPTPGDNGIRGSYHSPVTEVAFSNVPHNYGGGDG